MNIDFSRKLIKGRIAEVVFEQMIRTEGNYDVIPFGYEHTMPTLAQHRHISEVPKIIDNISEAPDFALLSKDKKNIFLVEVKFQRKLNLEEIVKSAEKLLKRWESPWMFIATPDGFYCTSCRYITNDKRINEMSENWVKQEIQDAYKALLNEFIR